MNITENIKWDGRRRKEDLTKERRDNAREN
jgi:hypothetical protein